MESTEFGLAQNRARSGIQGRTRKGSSIFIYVFYVEGTYSHQLPPHNQRMNPALRFLESDVQPYSLRNRAVLIKKDICINFVILYGHNKGSPSHILALRTFNSSSLPEEQSPTCFIFDVLHSLASSRLSHFTIFYF